MTIPKHPLSKNWWFGVCADVSKILAIAVRAVRLFVLLYTPIELGLIFYFIYYWFIKNRVSSTPFIPEYEIQFSKIKSSYFGS